VKIKTFKSLEELELVLLEEFRIIIINAIEKYGDARILLSGGTTPIHFYSLLSELDLQWKNVKIGLVDERFVPLSNKFSNEAMIRRELLKNNALEAEFSSMVLDSENTQHNIQAVNHAYELFKERVDIVLLGMGEDGHIASLFPNDPYSDFASLTDEMAVFNTQAPEYPQDRITCGQKMLIMAEKKLLLIKGVKKLEILKKSKLTWLPITPFILASTEMEIYYAE
jgi:6-phosphogluconolactonase